MLALDVSAAQLYQSLSSNIEIEKLLALGQITADQLPLVAYTSFDGDLLSHSELMKQHILKMGLVPLNPESALGTYLVVNHYGGDKVPIIEDCLSLIETVDRFFVMSTFIPQGESEVRLLPEGVIAELLYWVINRGEPATYVDVSSYNIGEEAAYTQKLLQSLDERQAAGVESVIRKDKLLRSVAYLLSGEMHAKHSDWMRKDAYIDGRVPLCPYTLINFGTLQAVRPDDWIWQLTCRVALAIRAEVLYVYGPQSEADFEAASLPTDALLELYLVLKIQPSKKVFYKSFADIGVPKYANRQKWAITDLEKKQTE